MNWKKQAGAICGLFVLVAMTCGQGTAFFYQGHLNYNNSPATGVYNFAFSVYATNNGGQPVAGPVTNFAVSVNTGVFETMVDFGPDVFNGEPLWLDISVETNGADNFTELSPRQPITPLPYAIFADTASNLSGGLPAADLNGTIASSNLPANPTFSGVVTASSFAGTVSTTNLSGTIPSGLLPSGVVTNTALGLPVLNPPTANWPSMTFTLPPNTGFISGVGDSYMYGYDANPLTNSFPWLIARSNNVTLLDYATPGYCVGDYNHQVFSVINRPTPLVLFDGGINDEIRDAQAAQIPGFTEGLLADLTLMEIGTNRVPATQMNVVSGNWSTISSVLGVQAIPEIGLISTTPGAALSAMVAGKTIIIGADDFNGTTNTGAGFSVTIDGVTVGTNCLTNAFASILNAAYESAAFYYPNYQEGLHSVVISNLGPGDCAIEYVTTAELAASPPMIQVFDVPPQTNYATGPGGSALSVNAHNQAIQYVCSLMDYCGFPVGLVDTYGIVMSATGGNLSNPNIYGDSVHLTNAGHLLLAQAALRQIFKNPSGNVTLTVGGQIAVGTPGIYVGNDGQILVNLASFGDGYPGLYIVDPQGDDADQFFANGPGNPNTQVYLNYDQFILYSDTGLLENSGAGQFGGTVSAAGFASTATGRAAPPSITGVTNSNPVTWIYDITATNATIVQFDGRSRSWDTNIDFTGSKEFIVQPGGGWTNNGTVTVTGGHAF